MIPIDLARLISGTRCRFMTERILQDGIENLFLKRGIEHTREMILSPADRIDFLVGSVGIEVKIDGSFNNVQRQLWRYAADARISDLILVTTRSSHRSMPTEITGKPIYVVHLVGSIF
jgi:hypothetical protein